MNCSKFEATLNERVEARSDHHSDEAVAHRQSCPVCESLWRDHCLLKSAISAWRPVEVPASLSGRVLRSLTDLSSQSFVEATTHWLPSRSLEPAGQSQRRPRRTSWAVAATVACVAMTCWMATRRIDSLREHAATVVRTTQAGSRVATHARPAGDTGIGVTGVGVSEVGVSESVVAVLADLKAEYQELANETTATARDFAAVMPQSVAWPRAVLSVREALPTQDVTDAAPQPGVDLGRSIGDQIGQAIGFLWETVPSRVPSG